jgi:hypothetical protein
MKIIRRLAVVLSAVALLASTTLPTLAESPARVRTLTCSDGTIFNAEQVRHGRGRPPHTWRNVERGEFPTAFTFHAVTMVDPQGNVVPSETWDNTQGVERNQDLVTCSFEIPVGPLAGNVVTFEGFFVP